MLRSGTRVHSPALLGREAAYVALWGTSAQRQTNVRKCWTPPSKRWTARGRKNEKSRWRISVIRSSVPSWMKVLTCLPKMAWVVILETVSSSCTGGICRNTCSSIRMCWPATDPFRTGAAASGVSSISTMRRSTFSRTVSDIYDTQIRCGKSQIVNNSCRFLRF